MKTRRINCAAGLSRTRQNREHILVEAFATSSSLLKDPEKDRSHRGATPNSRPLLTKARGLDAVELLRGILGDATPEASIPTRTRRYLAVQENQLRGAATHPAVRERRIVLRFCDRD